MCFRREKQSLLEAIGLRLMALGAFLLAAEIGRRIYVKSQLFSAEKEPVTSWNPEDYGIPSSAVEEVWIDTPDGERLYGWYCRADEPRASALYCHGNTGNLTISADNIPHFLAAGLNVLYFDYRGFGKSSGSVSLAGVLADAVTAARFHDTIRPQHLPSILYGFSLGGAVAAQILPRHPFDALILQSTFTSLARVARLLHPKTHFLSGGVLNTLALMREADLPLLIIHGTDDEVCPCSMADELLDACPSPHKRIHRVRGGLHKDLFQRDPDSIVRAISQFLGELAPGRKPA